MEFGQVIQYKERKNFFQNHAEKEAGRLVPYDFLFLKSFIGGKSNWSAA